MTASDGIPEIEEVATIGELADEGDEGSGSRRLFAVIALVALIFFLLWLFLSQTANVPDVVGMQRDDAKAAIVEAGFAVGEIEEVDATGAKADEITAQAPAAGARALKGSQIDLTVATGETGSAEGGSEGGSTTEEPSSDLDYDISATPTDTPDMGDGSSGAAIDYGPQVPSVLGMPEAKAISTLKAAGYYPVIAGRGPSSTTVAKGLVYYQDPAPDSFEPAGHTISLWISTGTLDHGAPYPQPE